MPPYSIILLSGLAVGIPFYYSFTSRLHRHFTDKVSVINDIPNFGVERKGKRIEGTAVVCGGSISGLLAARSCADHFEDVLIVEPEVWLGTEEGTQRIYDADGNKLSKSIPKRTRVMQYDFLHALLVVVYLTIERICPDAIREFENSGAMFSRPFFNAHSDGIRTERFPSWDYADGNEPLVPFVSRETFELTLRRLIYKPGGRIRWLSGTVTDLKMSALNGREIESVTVRTAGNGSMEVIPATLVIDCTGRTQAGMKWLARLLGGDESPIAGKYVSYDPKVRYTTFRFPVPTNLRPLLPIPGGYDNARIMYYFLPSADTGNRIFALYRIEGHRIEACCGGWGDADQPTDCSQIIPWLKTFKALRPIEKWVLEVVEMLQENKEEVVCRESGRIHPCSWMHYEQITNLPSNFAAIGDSVMCLNPIFGQGVHKACVGTVVLDKMLRSIPEDAIHKMPSNFSASYFRCYADKIAPLWNGTISVDYGWDSTIPIKGESLSKGSLQRSILACMRVLLSEHDNQTMSVLFRMRHQLGSSLEPLQPTFLIKLMFVAIRRYLGWFK